MAEERKLLFESNIGHLLVGIFVLVAAVGFAWLLVSQRQGPAKYNLVAEFDVMGNIDEATKVKLRGFTIGQVVSIDYRPQPQAGEAFFLVELGIEERYPVPVGTVAEIRSGLVGEAFVNLDVTASTAEIMSPGSRIEGRSDPGMKGLMEKVAEAARKLGAAGQGIKNANLGEKLGSLTRNVSRIADDLGPVTRSADSLLIVSRQMIEGMKPGMSQTVDGLQLSMDRLALTLARTDTLVAATSEDVRRSLRALRLMVERMERVLGRVDTLVQAREQQIDETLSNLHAASAAVREVTQHPWKLITGQGEPAVAGDSE